MPSITDKFGKASIDNNYAVATTVKTTRVAGVTVVEAFDLSKFSDGTPVFFITYKKTTNPLTGVVSVTSLVSWKGLVNVGANTLTNLTLAPGYVDGGNAIGDFIECIPTSYWENSLIDGIFVGHNPDGTFKVAALKTALGNDGRLVETLDEITSDLVVSGGLWALVSGLNGSMTVLAAYIDGYKNTVAAVATRAFTLSKDTYVDVLRNTGTNVFTLVYTEVANGAASPALAANSIRLALVVTSGAAITSVRQSGWDTLGNPISNTLAEPISLGTAARVSTMSGFSAENTMTSVVVKVPSTRREIAVKITIPQVYSSVSGDRFTIRIKEDGVLIQQYYGWAHNVHGWCGSVDIQKAAPAAGSHTYLATVERDSGTGTLTLFASATSQMQITVDLK